eukprot:TRINITY_DN6383_c0_g1_i1.p4 TRINITY_DN6383_c0_g1~~TRINITY_DN6383_c0_g1_i1.p4  ORF type:complete len:209 (+),score=31.45 TRINITY_DN6383_c0_g1_i1:387-1013(+)
MQQTQFNNNRQQQQQQYNNNNYQQNNNNNYYQEGRINQSWEGGQQQQQQYNNNSYNSNGSMRNSSNQFGGSRFYRRYNNAPVHNDNLSQAAKNWDVASQKEEQEKDWCSRADRELKMLQSQLQDLVRPNGGKPMIKKEQLARYVRKVRARLTEVKQNYRLDGPDQMWLGQTDKEYLVVVLELARDIQRFTKETLEATESNGQSTSLNY